MKSIMRSKVFAVLAILLVTLFASCSDETASSNNPTPTGPVLLATVSFDSVSTSLGMSFKNSSIGTQELDFTDRDSAEISFTYTGSPNNVAYPIRLYFDSDTTQTLFFSPVGYTLNSQEQYINATIASPKVRKNFHYQIAAITSGGFSYFKFKDLKIYKK